MSWNHGEENGKGWDAAAKPAGAGPQVAESPLSREKVLSRLSDALLE